MSPRKEGRGQIGSPYSTAWGGSAATRFPLLFHCSHSGPSACTLLYLSHALPTGDIPYHSFPPTSWLDQLLLILKVLVSTMPFLGSFLWPLKLGCLFTPVRFLSTWYLPCSGVCLYYHCIFTCLLSCSKLGSLRVGIIIYVWVLHIFNKYCLSVRLEK